MDTVECSICGNIIPEEEQYHGFLDIVCIDCGVVLDDLEIGLE